VSNNNGEFSQGDWIVHSRYGVGQIKGVEKKEYSGEQISYYKVKTTNSTFWVPVEDADNPRIRPIASKSRMQRALTALRKKPHSMDDDHNKRKKRIKEVLLDSSLTEIAELLRDLAWRQAVKKLNPSEEDAMSRLCERFVKEWSVSLEISAREARQKLHTIFEKQSDSVAG
jgi:CarD family transcriptional regulator